MGEKLISLARDFSRHPGGRFVKQGPHSGEAFRKVLVKALEKNDRVTVDLDGTSGIGSSFIDEAFGGLIFAEGMSESEVRRRVKVRSTLDESYLFQFDDSLSQAKRSQPA